MQGHGSGLRLREGDASREIGNYMDFMEKQDRSSRRHAHGDRATAGRGDSAVMRGRDAPLESLPEAWQQ